MATIKCVDYKMEYNLKYPITYINNFSGDGLLTVNV